MFKLKDFFSVSDKATKKEKISWDNPMENSNENE